MALWNRSQHANKSGTPPKLGGHNRNLRDLPQNIAGCSSLSTFLKIFVQVWTSSSPLPPPNPRAIRHPPTNISAINPGPIPRGHPANLSGCAQREAPPMLAGVPLITWPSMGYTKLFGSREIRLMPHGHKNRWISKGFRDRVNQKSKAVFSLIARSISIVEFALIKLLPPSTMPPPAEIEKASLSFPRRRGSSHTLLDSYLQTSTIGTCK